MLARDPTPAPPPAIAWTGHVDHYRFGEKINLPTVAPAQLLFAKVWIERSWPGELLSFLYKSAVPRVTFQLTSGASASYKFVYQTAPNGLLVSPHVADLAAYVALHRGQLPANVVALSFTLPRLTAWQFAPEIGIEFGHRP